MNTTDFQKLLFKAIYYCMAVDGEIHEEEKKELREITNSTAYFLDFNSEQYLEEMELERSPISGNVIDAFIKELGLHSITERQKLIMFEILFRIIEADSRIDENEKRYIMQISKVFNLSDSVLISRFPKHMDWLIDTKYFNEDIYIDI